MNIVHKKSILFGLIFFLGIGITTNAFALPWGSVIYHTSEDGKMYGYNNFESSFISGQVYPGAVGIYVGKAQKTGVPLVVEVDYGEVRIIPAKYFVDIDKGEEFVGAKIPQDFEYNHKIAKSIMRKIVAQDHELFDYTYGDQKGPQSGEWTSVGFVEKIYESANAPHLTYHPDPLMNYSYYAINITPDGFDNQSEINESGDCFSLSQEFSKIHKLGQGDFWEKFAFKEFKEIIAMMKAEIDISKILTINILGYNYEGERYFFFPATQFKQSSLKDVPVDIEIASIGKSQLVDGLSEQRRQINLIMAFSKRIVDETGKLCAKTLISKKFGLPSKIANFFGSIKSWLTIGKELADLSDADQIKINLDFLKNDNPVDNLDAALGFWRKTQQFVEFGAKESDEIADLVNKGLLSGPKADAKIEELLSDTDISDTPVLEGDFIQYTDEEEDPFLIDFVGGEDFSDTDEIKEKYEEFVLDTEPEEELEEDTVPEELEEVEDEKDDDEVSPHQYLVSDIVINEFVSDPSTGEVEWIELFNNTGDSIDLTNWTIEDNTESLKSLEGLTLESYSWLVLNQRQDFSFFLNNTGDIIKLKYNDTIIDQISYGDFDDGDASDNAPEPSKGQSSARNIDGQDTNNDKNDFSITTTLTKGVSNIITAPEIDTTVPEISLDSFPDSLTNQTSAQFEFSANEIVVFSCWIDEEMRQDCVSPQNYNDLSEGGHIFYLEAIDQAGNIATKNYEWTIDLTAPISNINLANNIFNSVSWPDRIEGTASSNATTTSDILEVKIQVQKISNQQYLGHTTSTSDLIWRDSSLWLGTILGNTTSTTPTWNFDLSDSLLTDDYYSIYSQAFDTFGNAQNSTSTADFIFDNTAPEQVVNPQIEEGDTALDLRVSWDAVEDNLSGLDHYEISWSGNTTSTTDIFFNLTGEDGQTYSFKTRAIDKAGNQGQWSDSVEYSIDLPTVLLSEIQIADNEFVELYNPTDDDISLENWYFAYYTKASDWNEPLYVNKFPEQATINSKDYYLIGLNGYLGSVIDWLLYDECQFNLSNENGSIVLYSYNPSEKTSEYLQQNYTDVFAWGNPQYVKEGTSFSPIPGQNYSFERKQGWPNGNGEDTDNNLQDFFSQINPNPQSSYGLVNNLTLFEDDFSDGNDDNWTQSGEILAWQVVDQKCQVDLNGTDLTAKILTGEDNWRNYQIDVDIIFDNGVDRSVLFGYQDAENYYQLILKGTWQSANPEIRLEEIQQGQSTLLSSLSYPLLSTFNNGQEYQFTIGVNDDIIQIYLDNEKMMEYDLTEDARIPQGKIGFSAHSGDAGSGKMSIDNIKIKTLFQGISLSGLITLPYEENFDGALPDYWKIAGPNNCPTGTCPENAWQIVDNKYQVDLIGTSLHARAITGSPDWEDYQLDVDITLNDGIDRYVILRYQSQENYYLINLRGYWGFDSATPGIYLDKIISSQGTNLAQYLFPGKIYFNQEQEYHLTAVVESNNIRVYIDGEKIVDYIDDTLPITYGKIGFTVSSGDSEEGDMAIDNLQVREISDPLDLPSVSQPQLSENFDDGNSNGWNEEDYWNVVNEQYGVSVVGQQAVNSETFIGDYSWQDYQMEFDINLIDGVDRYVMFRRADNENFYQLNFMGQWSWMPKLRLYRISTQSGNEILEEVQVFPNIFNDGESHHVKIIIQGENIKIYIDDLEDSTIEITDLGTRLTRGNIGLGVWTGDYGNAVVYWDNIQVTPL